MSSTEIERSHTLGVPPAAKIPSTAMHSSVGALRNSLPPGIESAIEGL
jgi:hypothetical protein